VATREYVAHVLVCDGTEKLDAVVQLRRGRRGGGGSGGEKRQGSDDGATDGHT
jgi:hypothetical protein